MKKLFILSIFAIISFTVYSQGVAINEDGSSPDASAMLDVQGADKGILVPRMIYADIAAIVSPANGLLAYATDSAAFYFYDGTSWGKIANQFQLGGATDYSEFEFDGTLVFNGNATTYEDLQVPGLAVATKVGDDPPVLDAYSGNVELYAFSYEGLSANEKQVFFTIQIPHAWKEGSTIYPHVHHSSIVAGDGTEAMTWGLEYSWTNVNGTYSASTTTISATDTIATTSRTHQVIGFPGGIDATGQKISSILVCRLFRNSSNTLDTFNEDVFLLAFDVHYEVNTTGSREQWVK